MTLGEFDDCQVLFEIWGWLPDINGDRLTFCQSFRSSNAAREIAARLHEPSITVWLVDNGEWTPVKRTRDVNEDLGQFDDPLEV